MVNGLSGVGSRLTRINQLGGERLYRDAYSPNSFSGTWSQAYQQIMEDIRVMNGLAAESGLHTILVWVRLCKLIHY